MVDVHPIRWGRIVCEQTPAFVYHEEALGQIPQALQQAREAGLCRLLFSLKSSSLVSALQLLGRQTDGFSVSSAFAASLASEIRAEQGTVHLVTPGIRPDDIQAIAAACDYVTFNSLSQWQRYESAFAGDVEMGLRVNPELSFAEDARDDACRKHSKLGVPIKDILAAEDREGYSFERLSGVHFHNNCDSNTIRDLLTTVQCVESQLSGLFERLSWVNLGGGYLWDEHADAEPFFEALQLLNNRYKIRVFVEPGAALVRHAFRLVSSVLDILSRDGKTVVVLDTSVSHMPEVFEYSLRPVVAGDVVGGKCVYSLVGCSCLPGDVFGQYAFDQPLKIGDQVTFLEVGAYTMVKWNWFNGINLPTIYATNNDGRLQLKARYGYGDFRRACGVVAG